MKKPKISLSGDAVKSFFTYHVEKLILVGVVVLVGLFVMWGYQLEGYTNYTPDRMRSDAEAARTNMNRPDVWTVAQGGDNSLSQEEERMVKPAINSFYKDREKDGSLPPIPADKLAGTSPINLPLFAPNAKRADPQVFTAEEVEVVAGYGPLAMPNRVPANPADPMAGLDPLMKAHMAYQEELAEKAAEDARQNSRDPRDGGGILEGSGLRPEFGLGGVGRTGNTEIPLTEEQLESIEGFQAAGGAGGRAVGGGVTPYGANYIAVTALAPYKKQWEEYESVLKDSAGYDLGRDAPQYIWFVVERAEVDSAGNTGPWQEIGGTAEAMKNQNMHYAGTMTDLVDPRYRDPLLTMAIPPIMLRDLTDHAVHSKTPLISLEQDSVEQIPEVNIGEAGPADAGPTIVPGQIAPGGGPRGAGGEISPPGYPRGGEIRGIDPLRGGEVGLNAPLDEQELVDYKLVRFFDFGVQPGKKYTYRVQLWVTDPNHPQEPAMTPPPSLLQEDVIARIAQVDRDDAKRVAADPNTLMPRTFWRKSDWSEPSKPVSIPRTWEILASEMVEPAKKIRIRLQSGQEVSFVQPGEEPKATSMAVVWDRKYAADIPGKADIYRGSVLNFETDVNVLHPPSTSVVTLPKYKFKTGALVLDMEGGEPLPGGDRKNPLMTPTEMLVIDGNGNMIVRDELDDMREFRLNNFEKPPEPEIDERGPEAIDPNLDRNFDPLFDGGPGRGRGRGSS